MIEIRTFTGEAAAPYFDDLARLRIDVFRAFPYLYEGDIGYERRYLSTYAQADESLFVLAFDNDRVIGASTGVPLECETEALRAPWVDAGINPGNVFYFGESVLLSDYRGQGLGHRFFDEREAYARRLNRFALTSFCAVDRDDDDPRRPEGYRPLHGFWQMRGYRPHDGLHCWMDWQEVDASSEMPHRLSFWSRPI